MQQRRPFMIYRVDFHVHTDGALSLDELVRAARCSGLDAIAITDRDRYTPVPIELRGVLLIPGCEITTLGGHIVGVFLEHAPDFARLQRHGLPTADEAVLEIHRCGGLAIFAHPFAEKVVNPALFPIRPDAVETINPQAVLHRSDANKRALLWAADHQRPRVGCSDAHNIRDLGSAYTEVACRRLTRAFLKEALDLGHCRPISVREAVPTRRKSPKKAKHSGRANPVKGAAVLSAAKLADLGKALRAVPAKKLRLPFPKKEK